MNGWTFCQFLKATRSKIVVCSMVFNRNTCPDHNMRIMIIIQHQQISAA